MNVWTRELVMLLCMVALGALALLLHLSLWLHALRAPGVPKWLRWVAWLPPLAAWAGLRSRAYGRSVLWFIVALAYLVLRSVA